MTKKVVWEEVLGKMIQFEIGVIFFDQFEEYFAR